MLVVSVVGQGCVHSLTPQSSLPALQRDCSRACLACGAPAEAYCARCGLAPYCSARCQQKDWLHRHRSVCHNLARYRAPGEESATEGDQAAPVPAPLRRPHSPTANSKPDSRPDNESDRPRKNFYPAGQINQRAGQQNQKAGQNNNQRSGRDNQRAGQDNQRSGPANQRSGPANQRSGPANQRFNQDNQRVGQNNNNRGNRSYNNQTVGRQPMPQNEQQEEEEDCLEPKAPAPAPAPTPVPTAKPVFNVTPSTSKEEKKNYPLYKQPAKVEPASPEVETVQEVNKTAQPALNYTVSNATPVKKCIPKNYLVETLAVGDVVLLSVDANATDRSRTSGYVCLSLHEKAELEYQLLCEDYNLNCETAAECKPNPGELFSYCNPEDGAYYRARCLSPTSAALIDSSKIVTLTPSDKCKTIAPSYANVVEFCCVLDAPNIKVGHNLYKCTLKSKTTEGYTVKVEDAETGADFGEGVISRWKPQVEYPVPKPVAAAVNIPEVPRPDLKSNSTVLLVEASSVDRVLVRPADVDSVRKLDMVLHDVLQYGMKATPIQEPPKKGQVVIGKFTDGNCYRALCKRINVNANKYQLEYIEFGNIEVNGRETIYACPSELDLTSQPTVVSLLKLMGNVKGLTANATEYLENLRDNSTELILTLPNGTTAPSGSEALLSLAKNKESVNKKVELMCTPEWKKIEERGGDVVTETRPLMISDLEHRSLPPNGCTIEVSDISMLDKGAISGCQEAPGTAAALEALTSQMEEYCNSELGKQPYLPNMEELCIARCPPYEQWFRAIMCEQPGGPGGSEARVCYVDYGNLETVPVTVLRKMLPEFVRGLPTMACHIEIRGFPQTPTNDMLAKAVTHMNINEEGRGTLRVTRCEMSAPGYYYADAPELLKAMGVQ